MINQQLSAAFILCLGFVPKIILAHEFWIEPMNYQLDSREKISASLRNGEHFSGTYFSYLPQRFKQFHIFDQSETRDIDSRLGDRPPVGEYPKKDGLHILSYVSVDNIINYKTTKKFETFANKQDLSWILEAHRARQLPSENITEVYVRFAKSLIASGTAAGNDRNLGLTFEFVALTNPYTREQTGNKLPPMQYQLLYQQKPVPDTRIDLFHKSEKDEVKVTYHRTNTEGIVTFTADKPGGYLVNAVMAREPSAEKMISTGALWETLWASSTFGVISP